jgi:hypothetical protein
MERRNEMVRILQAAWLALAALTLPGCAAAEDKAPDYRYRLTVEVETPDGLRTGSSVIEVRRRMGRTTMDGYGPVLLSRVHGEAVAVDLPGGKTLYALLRSGNDVDWATRVVAFLSPDQGDENPLDDVLLMEGKQELPRMWPRVGHIAERPAYPMLVTFGDEADPTSVTLVDPDDLAATFGAGVKLKRITAELTDDEVTTGVEKRLGWLQSLWPNKLNGDRFEDFDKPELAARLSPNSFSTEVKK